MALPSVTLRRLRALTSQVQWDIMRSLAEAPGGRATSAEIRDALALSPTTLSGACGALVKAGLLIRHRHGREVLWERSQLGCKRLLRELQATLQVDEIPTAESEADPERPTTREDERATGVAGRAGLTEDSGEAEVAAGASPGRRTVSPPDSRPVRNNPDLSDLALPAPDIPEGW